LNEKGSSINFTNTYQLSDATQNRFEEIMSKWPLSNGNKINDFYCDHCLKPLDIDPTDTMRKGYHVWYKTRDGKTLAELHFHRSCANKYL
jgi:hypothetical protein